jgi:hypothetical protein
MTEHQGAERRADERHRDELLAQVKNITTEIDDDGVGLRWFVEYICYGYF